MPFTRYTDDGVVDYYRSPIVDPDHGCTSLFATLFVIFLALALAIALAWSGLWRLLVMTVLLLCLTSCASAAPPPANPATRRQFFIPPTARDSDVLCGPPEQGPAACATIAEIRALLRSRKVAP